MHGRRPDQRAWRRRGDRHSSAGGPSFARAGALVCRWREALLTTRRRPASNDTPPVGRAPLAGRAAALPLRAAWGEEEAAATVEAVLAAEDAREHGRIEDEPPLSSAMAERGAPAADETRETECAADVCCRLLSERRRSVSACVGGPESTHAVRTGCVCGSCDPPPHPEGGQHQK